MPTLSSYRPNEAGTRARLLAILPLAAVLVSAQPVAAETGEDLWLRYPPVAASEKQAYRKTAAAVVSPGPSATAGIIRDELKRALLGLLGEAVPFEDAVRRGGTLVVGTPATSAVVAGLGWSEALSRVGPEGYLIRTTTVARHPVTVIASTTETGALYGTFHYLRLLQTGRKVASLDIACRPRTSRRLLNHWDNLDGTIERGYAGRSLWEWSELPDRLDPRLAAYARANASLGINGTVVNSVNANSQVLTRPYLEKVAALARVFRPYGVRVYLSANPAAPRVIGNVPTADPLDPAVARWWREKADEIYALIPDFGGFLVKANSEGQPGPQDYGRTHADGANVLADAVKPHGGIVMWRAFVYDAAVDPDRVKRAFLEFVPLDGTFRDNVLIQVKNGPLDFQPREPFHPLFGAMPKTPLLAELQITQEYLGQANHLVYLAPMWKEFLDADTYAQGPGSLVSKVVDGTLHGYRETGIAGVANTGRDVNWTGHPFGQANWYAYGRLAWDPDLTSEGIAEEWIRMTWGRDPAVVATIRDMMLGSREAFVDYTMPLGLHHLIGGDHYAPMPENPDPRRADWSALYYHRADATGIGFDRTRKGSGAVDQYQPPLRDQWNDPATTPETLLLWFHRLPWDYPLRSGGTLWDGLVSHYTRGAEHAAALETRWNTLAGQVDAQRHQEVASRLRRQRDDAAAWRDKCLRYFQGFSKRPIPGMGSGASGPDGPTDPGPSLKTLVPKGMLIGAALNQRQSDGLDALAVGIVTHHFNTVSPENLLKWQLVHPDPDRYAFPAADAYVAFGETHGMAVIGHTLVWHHQTPLWVFEDKDHRRLGREALLARLRDHIQTVVGRYRGRIRGWDVVNEALDEDGTLRRSPWLEIIGEDFIAKAFEYAHQADPQAELYYNDYNLWKPAKRAGALRIVGELRDLGLRVDGVGEQAHYGLTTPPVAEIEAAVTALAAAGVKVALTELDVDVLPRNRDAVGADLATDPPASEKTDLYREGLPDDKQQELARRYAEIFGIVMKHRDQLSRVTFWGVTDAQSWLNNFPVRGRVNHPLLWDRSGRPKPALGAVAAVLMNQY